MEIIPGKSKEPRGHGIGRGRRHNEEQDEIYGEDNDLPLRRPLGEDDDRTPDKDWRGVPSENDEDDE